MKLFLLSFIATLLWGCNSKTDKKDVLPYSNESNNIPDFNVALRFINEYADHCAPGNHQGGDSIWIQHNTLLTDRFKSDYQNILDSGRRVDPELGLDFDPIFDAQDFPDKGFSILKADTFTGYVTVVGNDWKNFTLVLKVVKSENAWLVDGAGIINIPKQKRVPR